VWYLQLTLATHSPFLPPPTCPACAHHPHTHRTPPGAACGCGCSPCCKMLPPACCSPTQQPCSASAAPWGSLGVCRCCLCPLQHSQVRDPVVLAGWDLELNWGLMSIRSQKSADIMQCRNCAWVCRVLLCSWQQIMCMHACLQCISACNQHPCHLNPLVAAQSSASLLPLHVHSVVPSHRSAVPGQQCLSGAPFWCAPCDWCAAGLADLPAVEQPGQQRHSSTACAGGAGAGASSKGGGQAQDGEQQQGGARG
jgi:hypothetical protein